MSVAIEHIVVVNDLADPKGGATGLAVESARQFRARGHRVTMLTGDGGDNASLRALGVDLVSLGEARLTSSSRARAFAYGLYNPGAARMIGDWIAAHDTPGTVYHLHGWSQILSPSIFVPLARVRDRLVLSAHDFFLACPNGAFFDYPAEQLCQRTPLSPGCIARQCDRRGYTHKLWRVVRQTLQNHLLDIRHAPPILAIHEAMRPFLRRAGIPDASIVTLPNPVRPWLAQPIAAERNREILFVGRMEATKGPDLAAAAARAAGATLRAFGDGALLESLRRDYPEMHFMGRQPPAAIAEHIPQARMLVMPSRYNEPFGLVAMEALWSGLPVIATDSAFLTPDIVAAGAGLAVEPRDTAAFAAAIRTILDDDATCIAMSHRAAHATRHMALTPDQWIGALTEIYAHRLSPERGSSAAAIPPAQWTSGHLERAGGYTP